MRASESAGCYRVRRRVKPLGWRLAVSEDMYRIMDGDGQVLHIGGLADTEAFLAAQPKPPLKYANKAVPKAWAQPIEDYLLSLAAAGQRDATLKLRRSHLTTMARGLGHPPEAVTGELLVGWFGQQKHWTPETRKGYRSAARGFFSWAYRTGRVPTWIGDELPKVRQPQGVPRPVPDEAFRGALAVADARTALMLRLAAEAGLRRAEVARVHTRDVVETVDGWSLLVHGKGGKQRVVPLSAELAGLIRRGAIGHSPELGAFGRGAEGWLFPEGGYGTVRGRGHVSPEWVGTVVSRVLPEGYTMHKLRTRFATRAYRGSRNLRAVQQLLGHQSIATTERYVATDDDEIRAAAAYAWSGAGL
jgi:integrase